MRRTAWVLILCFVLMLTSCTGQGDDAASLSTTVSSTEAVTTTTTTTGAATTGTAPETTASISITPPTGATGSDATTITFRENANVRVRFDEDTLVYPANFDGYMVHNKAEYDALRLETLEMHAPSHSKEYEPLDLTPYTEDYFTDKALVVLFLSSGAGNVQLHVDDLTVQDMCFLTVSYTEETPTVTTLESSDWCILLEVEAASVEKITDVVGKKTKVILP